MTTTAMHGAMHLVTALRDRQAAAARRRTVYTGHAELIRMPIVAALAIGYTLSAPLALAPDVSQVRAVSNPYGLYSARVSPASCLSAVSVHPWIDVPEADRLPATRQLPVGPNARARFARDAGRQPTGCVPLHPANFTGGEAGEGQAF
jgi:hypothetical protein